VGVDDDGVGVGVGVIDDGNGLGLTEGLPELGDVEGDGLVLA
jgi:hypothetical protein